MITAIGSLCFILVVFPNPIELAGEHKEDAVHPSPLQLNIHYYGKRDYILWRSFIPIAMPDQIRPLQAGFYQVATDDNHEWVIGVYILGTLCPIMAPRADLHNRMGRVKVRIVGNTASETAPLLDEYRVDRRMFREHFEDPEAKKGNLRYAEVHWARR